MEFGAQGEEKGSVMTARDYYITARHEIDPLYTNKSQQRLYLKCFLITWCNCSEEKTNEGCVYSTVGLVADGNLWQQPGNGELWPTGITCSLSSYNLLSDPGLRVYSFLTCRFLAKHLKASQTPAVVSGWGGGGCSRSDLAAACCCCSCWLLLEKDAQNW